MENPKFFNTWKEEIENCKLDSFLDCFREIEINISNVCNLKCPFCPHSKGYHGKPEFMTVEIAEEIARQLHSFSFNGYICIGGHGEPSLNPHFEEIATILKDFHLQLLTNGKLLDKETWNRLDKIGQIKVSVHDWKNLDYYKEKFSDTKAWFRNHDAENPQMNLFNRGGYLGKPVVQIERICHLPFYWVFIDANGKYLQCSNDWERISESSLDIYNTPIKDFFLYSLEEVRKNMMKQGGRQNLSFCKNCDINGTLIGEKFIQKWKEQENAI